MHRTLAILVGCCCLTPSIRAGEYLLPDGSPLSQNGGLIIMRQGGQTTVSLGGALLPRMVKVTTPTPEGPVVTRFTLPANLCSPQMPVWQGTAPASIQVSIPDPDGLIYIADQLIRRWGTVRHFESPPLPPGQAVPIHLRAAYKVGDRFLIEDRQVVVRAGENIRVTFDGSRAFSVPLAKGR